MGRCAVLSKNVGVQAPRFRKEGDRRLIDTGLRLTDGDSFGLTLAGLTTASLSADYFLIL